ncbi:hypothetical protein [Goodfellowiella coeruleoviolacea]|uniref:Uncharacterized protein n=1 Tax=Goodfellowiella coeruleoviolacea TaxID=334858 RepID=A0AAE3GIN9_9PSEU|nr:hypothetical protein [Goodfellowiella coeruleoviolacea]MCP2166858.1 hypothetical protein [Goodfellowiella coeruleoviolacea]
MTQSIADYVWVRDDRNGAEHAVLKTEAAGDSEGYIDTACTRVLIKVQSTALASPTGRQCPYCLSAIGPKVGDAKWR